MRGKDGDSVHSRLPFRITPAYAGKSAEIAGIVFSEKDHPRLCGEKDSPLLNSTLILGSPPPMRGKGPQFRFPSGNHRITPAYAGKRIQRVFFLIRFQDHPRLCGEKYGYYTIEVSFLGSPPPMRGKAEQFPVDHGDSGITPAYAGKS